MLNEVTPSGRIPHSSPSSYAFPTGRFFSAAAIGRYFRVQSRPVRVNNRTSLSSIRAWMRYPSNLISCNQSKLSGGCFTNSVSWGFTHRNRICADHCINGCRGDSRDCLSRHQPRQRLVLASLLDSPLEGDGFELPVPRELIAAGGRNPPASGSTSALD